MTTTDGALSAARATTNSAPTSNPHPLRQYAPVAAWMLLSAAVVTYAALAVTRASAGNPIDPWVHVLVVNLVGGGILCWVERRRQRILGELRTAVRRLGPALPERAYVAGYLEGSRRRLAGRDAQVIQLRRRTRG
jgi:hypothetical protein